MNDDTTSESADAPDDLTDDEIDAYIEADPHIAAIRPPEVSDTGRWEIQFHGSPGGSASFGSAALLRATLDSIAAPTGTKDEMPP